MLASSLLGSTKGTYWHALFLCSFLFFSILGVKEPGEVATEEAIEAVAEESIKQFC